MAERIEVRQGETVKDHADEVATSALVGHHFVGAAADAFGRRDGHLASERHRAPRLYERGGPAPELRRHEVESAKLVLLAPASPIRQGRQEALDVRVASNARNGGRCDRAEIRRRAPDE